jgi:hypothetical protein
MARDTYTHLYDGKQFPSMTQYTQSTDASSLFACLSRHSWAISIGTFEGVVPADDLAAPTLLERGRFLSSTVRAALVLAEEMITTAKSIVSAPVPYSREVIDARAEKTGANRKERKMLRSSWSKFADAAVPEYVQFRNVLASLAPDLETAAATAREALRRWDAVHIDGDGPVVRPVTDVPLKFTPYDRQLPHS